MEDSGAIAGMLWDRWLPAQVKAILCHGLDGGDQEARRRMVWLAAVHDLGKATPVFAMQVPSLRAFMQDQGFEFRLNESFRDRLPHSLASHYLLKRWLVEIHGWGVEIATTYAIVPGSHHGVPPSIRDLHDVPARAELFGKGQQWATVQAELARYALALAVAQDDLVVWAEKPLSPSAQVLATAVVIVADWLASDSANFPYLDPASTEDRVGTAWQKLNLIPAWQAARLSEDINELFRSRFGFAGEASVRPIQRSAVEVADKLTASGIMIIEAPMGEGKTEAALAAAEIIAARSGAGGCFIALPTMATSDAMFSRVRAWLEHLPNPVNDGQHSLFLAHGKASLNTEFADLVRAGKLAAIDEEYFETTKRDVTPEEVVVAHEWLHGRKKGPLSNFVVGTIDQVLFAGLRSRHLMLRHLALANKVVIIDEVHAFDAYMNVYLDRVLTWLGNYKVPVIVLSATLPSERRKTLLMAYESGIRSDNRYPTVDRSTSMSEMATAKRLLRQQGTHSPQSFVNSVYDILNHDLGYPVITASTGGEPLVTRVPSSSRKQTVQFEKMADDDVTLLEFLDTTLIQGGCIAIIRNTVARAQHTMKLLQDHFGESVDLTLAHSRFVTSDRMEIDQKLRLKFGSPSAFTKSDPARPHKAIVIGTQVLEQSLDIDFDLLITDLAPSDLLLQRIGRLHRHARFDRPEVLSQARCVIVGVEDWNASPPTPVSGSVFIYGSYLLLRTLIVLREVFEHDGTIELPKDIPLLVERTYGALADNVSEWVELLATFEKEWNAALESKKALASGYLLGKVPNDGETIVGWVDRGVGDADDESPGAQAQVRDTEDTLEVVLVRQVSGEIHTLPELTKFHDRVVPTDAPPSRPVALAVANSSIRLPLALSRPWQIDQVIGALERNAFPGWQQSSWLRGQLVLVLNENLEAQIAGCTVRYSKQRGLEVSDDKRKEAANARLAQN